MRSLWGYIALALLLLTAACRPEDNGTEKSFVLVTASLPSGLWQEGDLIGVSFEGGDVVPFELSSPSGLQKGTFGGKLIESPKEGQRIAACFPYRGEPSLTDIPVDPLSGETRLLASGRFGADGRAGLAFSDPLASIEVTIVNPGIARVLRSVRISAPTARFYLKGVASVGDDIAVAPTGVATDRIEKAFSLDIPSSGTASLLLRLIPVKLPDGFTLTLEMEDGMHSETVLPSASLQSGQPYTCEVTLRDASKIVPMQLCSFNIRFCNPSDPLKDGDYSWEYRIPAVDAFLSGIAPDVVALQEPRGNQLAYLIEKHAGVYEIYAPSRNTGADPPAANHESCALMVKKSRFVILDKGCFWMSASPSLAGSTIYPETDPRMCSWAHLADRLSGYTFWLFNAHMALNASVRRQECPILLSQIRSITGMQDLKNAREPVIVCGDLNTPLASGDLSALSAVFSYARTDCPETTSTYRNTYNAFGQSEGGLIDHFFYSGLEPLEYFVDTRNYGILYISDHYPVLFKTQYLKP